MILSKTHMLTLVFTRGAVEVKGCGSRTISPFYSFHALLLNHRRHPTISLYVLYRYSIQSSHVASVE